MGKLWGWRSIFCGVGKEGHNLTMILTIFCLLTSLAIVRGSAFGNWTTTADGILPAFSLGPDATIQAQGRLIHQYGNDRLDVLVAPDGIMTLRQDEGGPKLLNGFNSSFNQFRGGLGYVWTSVSSNRPPDVASFCGATSTNCSVRRLLGVGTSSTHFSSSSVKFDHGVTALFGDSPFVVSEVNVTSLGGSTDGVWAVSEVWSGLAQELIGGFQNAEKWSHSQSQICLNSQGRDVTLANGGCDTSAIAIGILDRRNSNLLNVPPYPTPNLHDPSPRPVFIVALFEPNVSMTADASSLYPSQNPLAPTLNLNGNLSVPNAFATQALQVQLFGGF